MDNCRCWKDVGADQGKKHDHERAVTHNELYLWCMDREVLLTMRPSTVLRWLRPPSRIRGRQGNSQERGTREVANVSGWCQLAAQQELLVRRVLMSTGDLGSYNHKALLISGQQMWSFTGNTQPAGSVCCLGLFSNHRLCDIWVWCWRVLDLTRSSLRWRNEHPRDQCPEVITGVYITQTRHDEDDYSPSLAHGNSSRLIVGIKFI